MNKIEDEGVPDQEDIFKIKAEDVKKIKSIGKGSFGQVYLGEYIGTDVAIKSIEVSTGDDQEIEKLFVKREIAILKACRHPNIVTFMGIIDGETNNVESDDSENSTKSLLLKKDRVTEIVLEYCSKGDLRQFLKNPENELSWRRRISMSIDIAKGMAYLHNKNIIFRDLKCKNFLLDYNKRVKLTDFGFARHHTDTSRPKTMCGTDGFMAPEIILGLDYDSKSDVFSFGMVLFEIITRQRIDKAVPRGPSDFFGVNVEKVRQSNIIPQDCPTEFSDLAFWCCEYEPKDRPDFKKLIVALQKMLTDIANNRKKSTSSSKLKKNSKIIKKIDVDDIISKAQEYIKNDKEGKEEDLPDAMPGKLKSPRDKLNKSRKTILNDSIFKNPE